MKRPESSDTGTGKRFDIIYHGRRLYQNLTIEDCSEVLQDFSERFYSGEDIDPNELELEEIVNG